MKFILKGKPKSTQTIYKVNCSRGFPTMYMSKEGKEIKEAYQWEIKSQYKKKPIKGNVYLDIYLYFGDKRIHDIDNYNKILLDAFTGIVWEDDSQIQRITIVKLIDIKNPRIEITIE